MPLHDWSELAGWEGMHLLWMTELLRFLKTRLPTGFRAYLGTGPAVAVGAPPMRPDVSVRSHEAHVPIGSRSSATQLNPEPDVEVAVAALDPAPALFVEREGRLVAAIELVSPRNKDRPVARATYLSRYAGYLIEGVHLLLVDVLRTCRSAAARADGCKSSLRIADESGKARRRPDFARNLTKPNKSAILC